MRIGFWGLEIMESFRIGRTLTGRRMGTFALGMGWFQREKSRR
jgi:hypothetical protein